MREISLLSFLTISFPLSFCLLLTSFFTLFPISYSQIFITTHLIISPSPCHLKIDERDGENEQFDQYGLQSVLKDYMYADKATRYQIVKNHFERAVTNAKVRRKEGKSV